MPAGRSGVPIPGSGTYRKMTATPASISSVTSPSSICACSSENSRMVYSRRAWGVPHPYRGSGILPTGHALTISEKK
ncbi:hypothetical protein GCM10010517_15920 [Streptosporangium fragile]|uniref:Uncharacterized protein n=1 Tax=Streptosporangium fragile TaxID=46186 RepID=A0ABN3VSM2_9ACTN